MEYLFICFLFWRKPSVTYPFTLPATKKDKLSRQMDDAENECSMQIVPTFADESLTLKPTRPMG